MLNFAEIFILLNIFLFEFGKMEIFRGWEVKFQLNSLIRNRPLSKRPYGQQTDTIP